VICLYIPKIFSEYFIESYYSPIKSYDLIQFGYLLIHIIRWISNDFESFDTYIDRCNLASLIHIKIQQFFDIVLILLLLFWQILWKKLKSHKNLICWIKKNGRSNYELILFDYSTCLFVSIQCNCLLNCLIFHFSKNRDIPKLDIYQHFLKILMVKLL